VSVQDFVGDDHLQRFVVEPIVEHLDLGKIEAAYASYRGQRSRAAGALLPAQAAKATRVSPITPGSPRFARDDACPRRLARE
jgi:hypothetical protein